MASQKHLPPLDGIRGLAILIVLTLHFGGGAQSSNVVLRTFGRVIHVGWCGVSLFFVLSGFLISGILWDARETTHWWRNFYIRRSLRIFPLYYGALLLTIIAAFVAGTGISCLSQIWVFAIYLQNVPWLFDRIGNLASPLLLGHFWSLAVEEQFYILWPFFLIRMKTLREARYLCLGVFCASEIFRIYIWHFANDPERFASFLPTRGGELAMGAFLAMSYRDGSWDRMRSWAPAVTAVTLVISVGAAVASGTFFLTGPIGFLILLPGMTIVCGGLLVLSLDRGLVHRLATMGWLRWLGGISYGVYVFHGLFMNLIEQLALWCATTFVHHAGRNVAPIFGALLGLPAGIGVAWLSFHFYEMPFLRLRKRYESSGAPKDFRHASAVNAAVSDAGPSA